MALLAGAQGAQMPFPNSDSELEQRMFGDPWASINTLNSVQKETAVSDTRGTPRLGFRECGGSKLDRPVALRVKALHTARFRRYFRRSYPSSTIRYVAAESHLDSHLSPGISFISPPVLAGCNCCRCWRAFLSAPWSESSTRKNGGRCSAFISSP